ncbi:DDE-type integrase/transposase/recombinase, partial [Klebsiella pneumoniae]|uniref:DDE-type integrase/transposase/recombinase n=1 Tax=Klebsiella pneumoniae TaxID=573 RepID=UPI002380EC86
PITWPFAVWDLDIVGPLKIACSGFTHLLVAVDKFTKSIEAKPIKKLDGAMALKFVKDLVVQFGVPLSIITDNGTNLSLGEVEEYCHQQGIRLYLAFVAHPQSNGQVERTNGLILEGIKPHLEAPLHRAAGAWA